MRNLALALALLSCVLYCLNGELLQALQREEGSHASPLLNLLLCHLGGLVFLPHFGFTSQEAPKTKTASLLFAALLMGYNYAWLLSATYVDLRLTNAVFQVSVALVYLCSVQLFDEVISFDRSLGVLLSLLGSFMASGAVFSGTSRTSARSTLIGTFLALLAAVGYTAYQTLFRWSFGHLKSHVSFLAGFGAWVSLWHLLLGFPLVFLAHLCGIEHLQWPSSWSLWLGTGFSALVAAVVNALYLCIVMWGSPMLLPSTSALSVPLTVFLDMALHEAQPERAELLGQLLVLISVVLIMRLHGGSILPTKRTVMKAAELVSL